MTSQVKILLQAMYKDIVGKREIVQEVNSDSSLLDLLNMLAKSYGKDFNDIVDHKTGQVSTDALVMLNGQSVRKPDVKLKNGDVVMIAVPVGGG